MIKLNILINGDMRKFVQDSCHTGISIGIVYFKTPTVKLKIHMVSNFLQL